MTWIVLETIKTKERVELINMIVDDIIKLYGNICEEIQTTVSQKSENNDTFTIRKEYKQKPKFKITTKYDNTIVLSFNGDIDEFENLRQYLYIKYDLIVIN